MPVLILFICIGFLLAVLWIDLIFDAMVLPYGSTKESLPEEVLITISSFFRRITYNPLPLYVIMIIMLAMIILQIVQGSVPAWVG